MDLVGRERVLVEEITRAQQQVAVWSERLTAARAQLTLVKELQAEGMELSPGKSPHPPAT